jgi:protein-S-isoprenylcysteine O-methyltransferase Ste14
MFVNPVSGSELAPQAVIFLFMLSGIALHVAAKLSLRRSMGVVAANRGVKMGGPYRFVRHPMYAGYVLVHTGLLMSWPSLFNLVILGGTWCLFLLRIIAEERILSEDPAYRQLKQRIPFRLIPGVY